MMTNLMRLVLAIGLLSALAGCSRSHSEAGGDSSTHWLRSCSADDQCGGLSCLCGVCSKGCNDEGQCAQFGGKAACLADNTDACGPSKLFCDAECTRDEDCGGSALTCEGGRCRKLSPGVSGADKPVPLLPDGSSLQNGDASTSEPDASTGEFDASMSVVVVDGAVADGGSAPIGASCTPQRAQADGTQCARSLGYAWNGNNCEELVCGCIGDDCSALFATKAACDAAYDQCISPATACSGLPWYQCFDHCPTDWNLAGGGRSFGECAGDCSFELTISPPVAPNSGSCTGTLGAELHIDSTDAKSDRFVSIGLSHEAMERGMRLSRAIAGLAIEPVTGCPDCLDQGSGWLRRFLPGDLRTEQFAYEYPKPPLVLREVNRFIQQLIDQAKVCRGALLASCTTRAEAGTGPIEPICGVASPATTPCICTVPFDQLSSLTGTSCDGSCPSCSVADSTCGANCVQPCAGGERKWQTYCTE